MHFSCPMRCYAPPRLTPLLVLTTLMLSCVKQNCEVARHVVHPTTERGTYRFWSVDRRIILKRIIIIGYWLDDRGVRIRVPVASRIFTSPCHPDRLWGPPNLLSKGCRSSFLGSKAAGAEADHSPTTSAEVKKMWLYTSTPPYVVLN
jgi:hypothetical protein